MQLHGTTASGFEAVRAEMQRNFAQRDELGAGVRLRNRRTLAFFATDEEHPCLSIPTPHWPAVVSMP